MMCRLALAWLAMSLVRFECKCRASLSSDIPSNDSSDDLLIGTMIDWLQANGAYINEKVAIRRMIVDDRSSPRGIFATHDMKAGETVCNIPWELIVKPSKQAYEEDNDCGTIESAIEAMIHDDITPYGKYLLAQPQRYTPGLWSALGRDFLKKMLDDHLPPNGIDDFWDKEWEKECNGDISNPLHVHALMLVRARADYKYLVPFYGTHDSHFLQSFLGLFLLASFLLTLSLHQTGFFYYKQI